MNNEERLVELCKKVLREGKDGGQEHYHISADVDYGDDDKPTLDSTKHLKTGGNKAKALGLKVTYHHNDDMNHKTPSGPRSSPNFKHGHSSISISGHKDIIRNHLKKDWGLDDASVKGSRSKTHGGWSPDTKYHNGMG